MVAFAEGLRRPFPRYWLSGFRAYRGGGGHRGTGPAVAAARRRGRRGEGGVAAVLPFAVNASMLGVAVLLLLTLPAVFAPLPQAGTAAKTGLRDDLAEGLRWTWRHAGIRDVTILAGLICAVDVAWFAVLVRYVVRVLHQQPGVYGLLLAAGGVGGAVPIAVVTVLFYLRHRLPWAA
jgi:hypothetical protein